MAPKAPQLKPPPVKPTDLKMPSNTPSAGGFDTSMLEKVANRKNKDGDKDKDRTVMTIGWWRQWPTTKRKSAIGE